MLVFADQPTLVCPYVVVHRRTSLMSSSLLHQVGEMRGKRLHKSCFEEFCFKDLFKATHSIHLIFFSRFEHVSRYPKTYVRNINLSRTFSNYDTEFDCKNLSRFFLMFYFHDELNQTHL